MRRNNRLFIMKKLPFQFPLLLAVCAVGCRTAAISSPRRQAEGLRWLLPTPRQATFGERFTVGHGSFRIENRFGGEIAPDRIALFAETLASRLGWRQVFCFAKT